MASLETRAQAGEDGYVAKEATMGTGCGIGMAKMLLLITVCFSEGMRKMLITAFVTAANICWALAMFFLLWALDKYSTSQPPLSAAQQVWPQLWIFIYADSWEAQLYSLAKATQQGGTAIRFREAVSGEHCNKENMRKDGDLQYILFSSCLWRIS